MSFLIADLPWLTDAPADFTVRRRAIPALDPTAAGAEIRALASSRATPAQTVALGRAIEVVMARDGGVDGLSPLKLAILSGSTFDIVGEQLPAAAARHGVALSRIDAGFDQVEAAAFDPASSVNTARADFALIAVDHRWLRLDTFEPRDSKARVEAALKRLEAVARALAEHGGPTPILCTVPTPPDSLFGSLDAVQPGAPTQMIAAANARILDLAGVLSSAVLDVASLAARIGGDAWFDPDGWFAAKLAFSPTCDPAYADLLGRLLAALRGRARKALVLDLDNTLWGGVVGDDGPDGPDGLRLGPGHPEGEAFAAVQAYALDLRRRGIFLAVSSKNDAAIARHAFETNPAMVLKGEDVAVFQANWADKASNLEAIATALNIGVDALVLLDDNPAERAEVRAALPTVAVPELPTEPSGFVRTLAAAGYFEAVAFSAEDAGRGTGHKAETIRAEVQAKARSLGDYLSSLEMRLKLAPFDAAGGARITQLINKTNQFNLTTLRRSQAEVAELEGDPSVVTMQAHLADRFGDLGMIALLIGRDADHLGEPALEIDTWLMSCRVLGRQVEGAMFAALLDAASDRGAAWLTGEYRPTPKNGPIADLLPKLGFIRLGGNDDSVRYALCRKSAKRPAPPIQVTIGSGKRAAAAPRQSPCAGGLVCLG